MIPPVSNANGKYTANVPPGSAIFPIFIDKQSDQPGLRDYAVYGTGFFVSKYGIFLTAKHVFEEIEEFQNGKGLVAGVVCDGTMYPCPINHISFHSSADIAVGIVATPAREDAPNFGISLSVLDFRDPMRGQKLYSYGYPRTQCSLTEDNGEAVVELNFFPDHYDGEYLEFHPNGISLSKWPVHRTSIAIASGMSGSPIFSLESKGVIGIACTGWSTPTEDDHDSFSTDIRLAKDIVLTIPGGRYNGKTLGSILRLESQIIE